MKKYIVAIAFVFTGLVLFAQNKNVKTSAGAVAGTILPSGIVCFKGIPYAATTRRSLRWKPTQPHARWSGCETVSLTDQALCNKAPLLFSCGRVNF